MMLMQSTNYKLLYLVNIGAKYLYKHISKFGKNIKIKNHKPDQNIVEHFGPVRSGNLNGLILSEKICKSKFLVWSDFIVTPNQTGPCSP